MCLLIDIVGIYAYTFEHKTKETFLKTTFNLDPWNNLLFFSLTGVLVKFFFPHCIFNLDPKLISGFAPS